MFRSDKDASQTTRLLGKLTSVPNFSYKTCSGEVMLSIDRLNVPPMVSFSKDIGKSGPYIGWLKSFPTVSFSKVEIGPIPVIG